jgi:hypothetical protein
MIRVSEKSEGKVVVLEAEGRLTDQDYKQVLIPRLESVISERGKARVLFDLGEKFRGWEWKALWDDARFGIAHRNDFEKMAVITDRRWISWAAKVGARFVGGEIKTFSPNQRAEACSWINA